MNFVFIMCLAVSVGLLCLFAVSAVTAWRPYTLDDFCAAGERIYEGIRRLQSREDWLELASPESPRVFHSSLAEVAGPGKTAGVAAVVLKRDWRLLLRDLLANTAWVMEQAERVEITEKRKNAASGTGSGRGSPADPSPTPLLVDAILRRGWRLLFLVRWAQLQLVWGRVFSS